MMMTVCWMDRITALESPDVAGGRYITRGGGDLLAAAVELPFVSGTSILVVKLVTLKVILNKRGKSREGRGSA